MHDFCFTIPNGLILVDGGLFSYLKKGSTASLGGGVAAGILLVLAGNLSLKAFQKRRNSYLALILQIVIAASLTWVMGQRYVQTSKIMPAGMIAGIRSRLIETETGPFSGCNHVSKNPKALQSVR